MQPVAKGQAAQCRLDLVIGLRMERPRCSAWPIRRLLFGFVGPVAKSRPFGWNLRLGSLTSALKINRHKSDCGCPGEMLMAPGITQFAWSSVLALAISLLIAFLFLTQVSCDHRSSSLPNEQASSA